MGAQLHVVWRLHNPRDLLSLHPTTTTLLRLRIWQVTTLGWVPDAASFTSQRAPRAQACFSQKGIGLLIGLLEGRVPMNIWTEFKNSILPWLLAGAVVAFLIAEHRRTTGALLEANTRLADAVEQQGKALDGVRALLASQGYTLPPLTETR
jgi:hypothetical protein